MIKIYPYTNAKGDSWELYYFELSWITLFLSPWRFIDEFESTLQQNFDRHWLAERDDISIEDKRRHQFLHDHMYFWYKESIEWWKAITAIITIFWFISSVVVANLITKLL